MTDSVPDEFTVSDLVRGWDDVRFLLGTTDLDQVWEVVSSWPAQRLAAAFVAVVTVARPDDAAAGSWPAVMGGAATGHVSGVCGGGHVSGHRGRRGAATVTADAASTADTGAAMVAGQPAATAWSAVMTGVVQPRDPAAGVALTCLVCGAPFVAARRDRRTCSPRCARRDYARRRASKSEEGRVCAGCGGVFVGGRSDRRHCNPRCRMRACRRRQRARRAAQPDGT